MLCETIFQSSLKWAVKNNTVFHTKVWFSRCGQRAIFGSQLLCYQTQKHAGQLILEALPSHLAEGLGCAPRGRLQGRLSRDSQLAPVGQKGPATPCLPVLLPFFPNLNKQTLVTEDTVQDASVRNAQGRKDIVHAQLSFSTRAHRFWAWAEAWAPQILPAACPFSREPGASLEPTLSPLGMLRILPSALCRRHLALCSFPFLNENAPMSCSLGCPYRTSCFSWLANPSEYFRDSETCVCGVTLSVILCYLMTCHLWPSWNMLVHFRTHFTDHLRFKKSTFKNLKL